MPSPLLDKSKAFALEIIKVCNEIKASKREAVLTNQLIRSGTSIGANIREAMYAHGKADFIAKLQIALKESSESEYWLELLLESGYNVLRSNDCSSLPSTQRKRIRHEVSPQTQYPRTLRKGSFLFAALALPASDAKMAEKVKNCSYLLENQFFS